MVFIFLLCTESFAQESLGKIIQFVGDVDITSLSTGKRFTPDIGTTIQRDYRIRTGKKSFVEILLNNGTKIFIKEITVLNVSNLRMKSSDPPTRLKMLTGKIRIIIKKIFRERTLILKTPTTVAGVRGTDFGAIASKYETKVVVFAGKVEVANINKDIIKSYILRDREEVTVKENEPPMRPRVVPADILDSWFDFYEIDEKNQIIIRSDKDESFIDKFLRKREF
jgi:ferric-dicitrate binding protein FerR (iron transport regulator)